MSINVDAIQAKVESFFTEKQNESLVTLAGIVTMAVFAPFTTLVAFALGAYCTKNKIMENYSKPPAMQLALIGGLANILGIHLIAAGAMLLLGNRACQVFDL